MTAQSPYSVPNRNSYLSKTSLSRSSSSLGATTNTTTTRRTLSFVSAFFWLIIRYWRNINHHHHLQQQQQQKAGNNNNNTHGLSTMTNNVNDDLEQFFIQRRAPILAKIVRYVKYSACKSGNVIDRMVRNVFSLLLPLPSTTMTSKSLPSPSSTTSSVVSTTRRVSSDDEDDDEQQQQQQQQQQQSTKTSHVIAPPQSYNDNGNGGRNSSSIGSTVAATATAAVTTNNSNSAIQQRRINENIQLINRIINYWFGQYNIDNSQKMLWMISNSSTELRKRVDCEIYNEFLPILQELVLLSKSSSASST